jgi:hypothetical protein
MQFTPRGQMSPCAPALRDAAGRGGRDGRRTHSTLRQRSRPPTQLDARGQGLLGEVAVRGSTTEGGSS